MTVLLGVTALAIDAGNLSDYRHRMQSAADAAALAGAREIKRNAGIGSADLQTFVYHDATANGFTNGTNDITITINHGPATGPFAGNSEYVEVLISRAVPTFFLGLFGRPTVTVGVRAVAGQGTGGSGCVYSLSANANGAFITSGSGSMSIPNCDIVINSTSSTAFKVGAGWTIDTKSISVVGGTSIANGASVTPTPETGADPVDDPFGDVAAPAAGSCTATDYNLGSGTATISPGTYCGKGITVANAAVLNFTPGVYVLTNGAAFVVKDNATVNGTGVTIWIIGTTAKPSSFTQNTHIYLSAPTTGTYAGIVLASSVNNNTSNVFGSNDMPINGIFYFPHEHVEWKGNGGAYTVVIADTFKITGGSSLNSDFSSLPGGSPLPGPVSMAE